MQPDQEHERVHFIGSLYIAYYFYVENQLYVSKYALCMKITKTMAELKNLQNK